MFAIMNRITNFKLISLVTLLIACAACSSTKQLQTQATNEVIQFRSGHIEDVLHTSGLQEYWVVPTERNGVMVNDTIRHRIDLNDTIHHRIHVTDTIHAQVLQEQTKAKVPQKQKGLADDLRAETNDQDATSVWLIISVGFNVLCILVIIIVISLNKNRFNTIS